MAEWPWVVVPALVTALSIRLDARLIGPYFTFTSIVYGLEGVDGDAWYARETLRWAVVRRIFYPLLCGGLLGLFGVALSDAAVVGFLTAGLLLWPAVFHGLPYGVSKRDWEIPALYLCILMSFAGLATMGWFVAELLQNLSSAALMDYVRDHVVDWILTTVVSAFFLAFFRGSFLSLRSKARRRSALGPELDFDGDSAFLDASPRRTVTGE